MKVTENNNPIQMDAYVRQMQTKGRQAQGTHTPGPGGNGPVDKVNLSSAARDIQRLAKGIGDAGLVNDEKVQKVKMDVDSGTYKVVGTRVANDMLKESFENDFILQKINMKG